MKHTGFFKRLLSMLLIVALLAGNVLPGMALTIGTDETGKPIVSFTRVDNSEVSAGLRPNGRTENTDEAQYAPTDVVRVSIILEKASTIKAGFSTMSIATNQAATTYRNMLKREQTSMVAKIESTIKSDLDVVWNLTLAANLISANVQYGQIAAIEKLPGVKSVVLETQYLPDRAETSDITTNMATSGAQTGSSLAWAAGYTGAGSRIAVIDTGTDTNHQSLNAMAFEYSLSLLAEKAGMSFDEYVATLDLLDAEEIAAVAGDLNVTIDADKAYFNTKLPFGFNYKDADYDITHDNDDQGEHGSHVAGIATANSWLYSSATGEYGKAMDYVFMQGVAPDAQLLTMKVFGKNGSPYDSDYFAAIEDAIVLGADVINLSLGSVAPGRGTHSNAIFQAIMDDLDESGVVVAISAGNSGPWAENAENGGYLYNTDVSQDTVGQPGSFTNSLCVASVENDGMVGFYIDVNGNMFVYNEDNRDGQFSNRLFREIAGEYEYIFIDGVGKAEDWAAVADVLPGKIALCSRGETNFAEKANLAIEAGAAAVFIYNNQSGVINLDLTEYLYTNPVAAITRAQGLAIRELSTPVTDDAGNVLYRTGKMTISSSIGMGFFGSEYYTMSDFSSWGVPGSLEMKPEITAPGGNIYSLNGLEPSGGGYEIMSGTSMASPQVAGMAALMAQYVRENHLSEKTGVDERHLIQSLLMSTAKPLQASKDVYYPVLQQGAGLANVYSAMTADSYIMMGKGTNTGAADGKVKVELFDDPDRVGAYSATFTVYNLEDVAKVLNLRADFFIQGLVSDGTNLYMDYSTTMIPMNVVWTVGGARVAAASMDLEGMDFNGDGLVNTADGQALLDYATGKISTLTNLDKADVDGDGDVDSHDAYVFLSNLSTTTAVLPAGGSVDIRVDFSLSQNMKDTLDEMYPNGTYLQGFLYAETDNGEGQVGTSHSIPVLGFFGNWTDPSMFDVGQWPTYATGEDTRIPYIGRTRGNDFKVVYEWDPGYNYSFGGNPLIPDSVYMPERNAMNSADAMDGVSFIAIRHANQSRVTVVNKTTGEVIMDQQTGAANMAYYYGALGWQNSGMFLQTNFSLKNASENDQITMDFTLVPEYYIDAAGNVDWDALGHGATLSTSFVIDNTAPELFGVSIDVMNNTMTITASDNQYVAAVGLYNKTGTRCLAQTGAKQDIEKGEVAEYTFSLEKVNGKKFLVQVFDYAMNAATYMIEMQIGEEADLPEMMAYDLVSRHWCGFDKTFEYNYKVGTPRVAYADHVFYAATIAEHYAFATTNKGELYVMPEDDLTDTTFITNLGQIMYDMAYNKADGEIYAVNDNNELFTIHKLTGELTKIGAIGLNTNTLACSPEGVFYCNELGTGKVYSFTLETMDAPQLLMEDPYLTYVDPIAGADMGGTTGNMGMEYNPNTNMICWNSHCEVLIGSYITYAYYYEIDPATGEFTRYNDFWHEMSGLMIPDRTGASGNWADPTDKVIAVKLNRDEINVIRGTSAQLTANVQPWTATDRTVTWTSADESIATVDKRGVVTGVKEGTTTIRATSNLDPDFYAECVVNVEILDVTIHGTTTDANGNSTFYDWDMSKLDGWKAGAVLDETMTSASYSTALDVFYMMDNVSGKWAMHKVSADGTTLQSAENTMGVAMWDMTYNPYFSKIHGEERVSGIYYYYLLSPKNPMSLNSVGFNLGDLASYLVGITSAGYEQQTDENGNVYETEHLILLDNDGYVWDFWIFDVAGGGMNALYNITKSDLNLEFPGDGAMDNLYTSLTVGDDGALYLSTYTENTNEIWHLSYDAIDHKYVAVKIGDMGENVWPATITSVTVNGGTTGNAASPKPAYTMAATEITDAELAAAATKASFSVNKTELDYKLNGVIVYADGTEENPTQFVIGDNTVDAPKTGYYFVYTAEKDGTATIVSEGTDWRATVYINDELSGNSIHNPKYDGSTITRELSAGDKLVFKIIPYSGWSAVDKTITVNFSYVNADGTVPGNPGTEPEQPEVETITVYFRNNWLWTDVTAYFWGSATDTNPEWPGNAMTFVEIQDEYEIYKIEIPADATGLIFNGVKNDGSGDRDQSPDVTEFADGDAFEMAWDNGNQCVKFDYVPGGTTEPEPGENSLVIGTNALESGKVYSYTATEEGRLEFDFVLKDADGKTIYQYAYGQGTRVKIMINDTYVPNIADTKVSVKTGDTVTVELVSVDGGAYTATLTLTALEPAAALVLGNNDIARKTDYSFIAPQDGTLYTTIVELWCDGTYCTEASLSSSVVFKINGTTVYGFQNSYEVKAGDEITVLLGTSFGEAANAVLNLSYDGFYQHPAGSRGNPYVLDYSQFPTTTVEIPAGEAVWYKLSGFYSGYYMDIYGENAYVIISGTRYDVPANGLRIPAVVNLQIGNDGTAAAAFRLYAGIEEGYPDNPKDLVEGDNTVSLDASDVYYYDFAATKDGTLTFTVSGDNWRFWFSHIAADGTAIVSERDHRYVRGDEATVTVELTAGQSIIVKVGTMNSSWTSTGGEITVNFSFTATGGDETCKHDTTEIKNAKAPTCTEEGYTGDEHCASCGELINKGTSIPATGHTAGAEATCTAPQICTVCKIQLAPAIGHSYENGKCVNCGEQDPNADAGEDNLVLGLNEGLASGTVYTYTATEEGRLEFDFASLKDGEGKTIYQYAYGKGTRVKIMINGVHVPNLENTKISVAAGQKITVELVPVDGGTYTVNLTMSALAPASKLVLGDNDISLNTDYSFIASQDGTLYTTIKELWCDGTYCSEASLSSNVIFKINGLAVYSFENAYEVKAGDEITVLLNTNFDLSGSAVLNLSFEGFYKHPLGSRGNPYILTYGECPTESVEIPAGETVWYKMSGFGSGYKLIVKGQYAYVVVSGTRYEATNGVSMPNVGTFQIGNAGSTAMKVSFSAYIEEGYPDNPKDLVEGDNSITLDKHDSYYFDFVAPQDGKVTVIVSGDNWSHQITVYDADGTLLADNGTKYQYKGDSAGAAVTLEKGQYIVIKLGTMNSTWQSTGGTLNVNVTFEPDEAACQHTNTKTETENEVEADCTTDGSYDTVVYCADCGEELSRETTTVPALGHNYENGYCTRCGEADPNFQPDPSNALVLGKNDLTSGIVYTYTVPADGRMEFSVGSVYNSANAKQYSWYNGSKLQILINGKAMTASSAKMNVTAGQIITVQIVSLDGDTYTADMTLKELTPAESLVIGNNDLAQNLEYVYVADKNGTVYVSVVEMLYNGEQVTADVLGNSVQMTINGSSVSSFTKSFEVKAGDEIAIIIKDYSWDGSGVVTAVINLSYEGFYEHPAGSIGNPVDLLYADCPTETIEIAAGSAVWYKLESYYDESAWSTVYPFDGKYLVITGEGAYVIIEGTRYDAVDGVVKVMMDDETLIQIGNDGSAAAIFAISVEIPEGTKENPQDLVEGDNKVTLPSYGSHYYDFTATTDGTVTVTVSGENWKYTFAHYAADGTKLSSKDYYAKNGDSDTVTLEIKAGEMIVVMVGTSKGYSQPGGDITVNFHFEPAEIPCQHENTRTEIENEVAGDCTTDGSYDEVVYCADCGEELSRKTVTVPAPGHNFEDGVCTACGEADPDYNANRVTVEITNDVYATNGIVIATWDPAKLTLVGVRVNADFFSIVEEDGSVTIGYVALNGIPAGQVVAELIFEAVDPADVDVAIEYKQINNDNFGGSCEHIAGEPVIENKIAASCVAEGSYDEVIYCTVCGEELSRETIVVSAGGHIYEQTGAAKKPTCTEDGRATYTCTVCGDTFTEVIEATGHEYEVVVTEPTCTENGKKVYTCTVCGDTYTEEIPMVDHNIVDGVCTECGYSEYVMGDVNGDGKIDTTDAKLIMQLDLGLVDETALNLAAADVNGDGKIDTTDAKLIMQLDLGLITEFPTP